MLWLRADLGLHFNGSNLSGWDDQSGQGNNVSQGTGSAQPAWAANTGPNNRPGVTFNPANSQCLVNAIAAPFAGNSRVVMASVLKPASTASAMRALTIGNNRTAHFNGFGHTVAGDAANHRDYEIVGTANEVDTTNNCTTNWEVWVTQSVVGPAHSLIVNGTGHTLTPNNSATVAPQAGLAVGCADATTPASFFNGVLFELIAYMRPTADLDATEIARLNAYLRSYTQIW